jgi:dephospho-CoA kinase
MKIILGLAGEMASGKGTVAEYLIKEKQGVSYRFSSILRDLSKRLYLDETRENLQTMSTAVREHFGQNILCKVIRQDVAKDETEVIIIDGVRRKQDVEELKNLKEFKLIYLEADLEKRFERIKNRGENSDDKGKTLEEFQKDHKREAEQEIKKLRDEADFIVDNNGSFTDLHKQIDNLLK